MKLKMTLEGKIERCIIAHQMSGFLKGVDLQKGVSVFLP